MLLERPLFPVPAPRQIAADFGGQYAASAVVAFLFSCTGPVAIILAVGAQGRLSESDIASWIAAAFCLNSVISVTFTLLYRQPLIFLWSIPGAVLVGPALGHLSFPEVIGAFLATGVLMLVLGLSGWVRRAMEAVPMPIVMAMVAGVFLRFGIGLVRAFTEELWIALAMTLTFVALSVLPRMARALPPLIGAVIVGALAIWAVGAFRPPAGAPFPFSGPNLYLPPISSYPAAALRAPPAALVLPAPNRQGVPRP